MNAGVLLACLLVGAMLCEASARGRFMKKNKSWHKKFAQRRYNKKSGGYNRVSGGYPEQTRRQSTGSSPSGGIDCTLPKDVGSCRANKPRFFYNTESGRCEEFGYGGCEGNSNNFKTYEECTAQCGNQQLYSGFLECGSHCYQRLNTAVSYNEAEEQCQQLGAHLAVPLSRAENRCAIHLAGGRSSWLGFSYSETEGEFLRADGLGALAVEDGFWESGKSAGDNGQDCVFLRYGHGVLKGWSNSACDNLRRPLCQLWE